MTGYVAGGDVIDVITSDTVITEFVDSFLDRSTDRGAMPLATIVLSGEVIDAADPACCSAVHGTVALIGAGREFRIGRRTADVPLDKGEMLGVLRKLVRELWLARNAPDGDHYYLHASAVDDGRQVIVFVGDKRGGKTTMMLDAVAHHGYRLLTNDGLLFVRSGSDVVMAPLPTMAKIRGDVARRYLPLLAGRALDPFNERQLRDWDQGPLFLTFGALGHRFAAIQVAARRVVVVGVRFGTPPELTDLTQEAMATLVERNRKYLPVFFGDLVGFVPATDARRRTLVDELAKQVVGLAFRHGGEVAPVLRHREDE
jgi:hypothetical protein